MTNIRRFALTVALILFPALLTSAQTPTVSTVNVMPDAGKVRVAAVGEVFDLRIEVTDETGETVFEGSQVSGRPLDGDMRDAGGERVRPGAFCVSPLYGTVA